MVQCQLKLVDPVIKEQMAYFLTDNSSTKGRDPDINIINGIHKIKGKTFINILVSNYTNFQQRRVCWTPCTSRNR